MEFRRRKGSDTWHWCRNCSNWPKGKVGVDYDVRNAPRKNPPGELDNECLSKERKGEC